MQTQKKRKKPQQTLLNKFRLNQKEPSATVCFGEQQNPRGHEDEKGRCFGAAPTDKRNPS